MIILKMGFYAKASTFEMKKGGPVLNYSFTGNQDTIYLEVSKIIHLKKVSYNI